MKRLFLAAIATCCSLATFAQKSNDYGKFDFELGFDVPTVAGKIDGYKNSVVPFLYFEGRWQLEQQPIDLGFHLGISVVSRKDINASESDITNESNDYRLVPIMAVADYQFGRGKRFNPYAGIGVGVSQNCLVSDFGTPSEWRFPIIAPRIGVRCFKTMNLGLTYYLTQRDYSRLNFSLGFYF